MIPITLTVVVCIRLLPRVCIRHPIATKIKISQHQKSATNSFISEKMDHKRRRRKEERGQEGEKREEGERFTPLLLSLISKRFTESLLSLTQAIGVWLIIFAVA